MSHTVSTPPAAIDKKKFITHVCFAHSINPFCQGRVHPHEKLCPAGALTPTFFDLPFLRLCLPKNSTFPAHLLGIATAWLRKLHMPYARQSDRTANTKLCIYLNHKPLHRPLVAPCSALALHGGCRAVPYNK